jgi:hypothetical protein
MFGSPKGFLQKPKPFHDEIAMGATKSPTPSIEPPKNYPLRPLRPCGKDALLKSLTLLVHPQAYYASIELPKKLSFAPPASLRWKPRWCRNFSG